MVGHVGIIALVLLASLGSPAFAAESEFSRPKGLERQVEFWKRIFAVYSENQAVVHDDVYLNKVIRVVDLPAIPEDGRGEMEVRRERQKVARQAKEEAEALLRTVDKKRNDVASMSAEEKRIHALYADLPGSRKYRDAAARVRIQTGIKERFRRGLEVSRRYLPHLEKIFREEGVPVELTRLPLIESSFQLGAHSKVGASGVWQFMPESARIYRLRMDEIVDERLDPFRAARAAAHHLRDDYKALGAWPLAVTAYNHGRYGVARAVRQTGTKDLPTIIRKYRSRSFGFASRNFYAEFVAALEVDREPGAHFESFAFEEPLQFDEIELDHYVPFRTMARLANADEALLQSLNPGFRPEIFAGKLYVPAGYAIRIPGGRSAGFREAYRLLGPNERFAAQRQYWIQHAVRSGETVGGISRRYGSSIRAIQQANGLRDAHRIRIGQVLRIPPRDGGTTIVATAPGRSVAVATGSASGHRVQNGETLGAIARRYGTTTEAIRQANGLASIHEIRAGKTLRIPGPGGVLAAVEVDGDGYLLHRVSPGQTVEAIAKSYGTTIQAIQQVNGLPDVHKIRAGQVLRIQATVAGQGA